MLSDVIGPPSTPPAAEDAVPATSVNPLSLEGTACGPGLSSESNLVESVTSAVSCSKMEQRSPGCSDPSLVHFDSEATLVSPSRNQTEFYFPQEDDEPVAELLPMPDDAESADGDATSYFVEDAETYAIGSEGSSDDDGEEDFTLVIPNRQSTLSSFTGVSLLASPRNSVFGEPSSVGHGAVDLLSPVELSAKLRPFSIPSLGSRVKRGDSIDSGYADGDNWAGPRPFPRSPPRTFRSPVTFLSHSRQTSHYFSALKDSRGSCDAGAVRLSSHNSIEGIKEVESDGCSEHGSEDNEDAAGIILGAYDRSPSEERGEKARDPLQVNLTVVTEGKVEDPPSEVRAAVCRPQQLSPTHLQPGGEYDVDSGNQASFVSDNNLPFKTAFSAQPSYEDLSNVSRVSPVRQDSLFPSISAPKTSVLSHYNDVNECSKCLVVSSDVYESSSFLATDLESHYHNARVSEESEMVVTVQESLPGVFHLSGHSPAPSTADISRNPSSSGNFAHESASQKNITLQEDKSGADQCDRNPLSLSPSEISSLVTETCDIVSPDDPREFSLQNVVVPREQLPSLLHCDRDSSKANSPPRGGLLGFAPAVTGDVQKVGPTRCSARLNLGGRESPHNPSMVENVLQGTGGRHNTPPVNVGTHPEHQTFNKHVRKSSFSVDSFHSLYFVQDALGHANGVQEIFLDNIVDAMEHRAAGVSGLPGSAASTKSLYNLSPSKHLEYIPPGADDGESGYLTGNTTRSHADQSLIICLGPNETVECVDSGCENFTQRLSFPLPPPFQLAEHSTPSGEASSIPSEATVMDLGGHGSKACTMSQEEVQRPRSSSDLTEKMRPRHLPPFRSPNSNADFTWRRSRAASDLTVKGKASPAAIPEGTPGVLNSPSLPLEQQGTDPVNSLYDQYIDGATSDNVSCPAYKATDRKSVV